LHSKQGQPEESTSQLRTQSDVENLQLLYDSLPCLCFTLSPTGLIYSISQFGAAFLGYEVAELTQTFISEIFYPEDQATCQAKLTELHQPNQISQWECRLVGKNDTIIWVKSIARLVYETKFHPLIILICEDITASKQLEETLRKSDELHRSTLSNISDTVLITNDRGEFTYICPNVSAIFGYSCQEIQAMGNVNSLLGENLYEPQVLDTIDELRHIEREVTDKTGQLHTVLVNVKRVSIQEGTVLYSCRDITDLIACKRTKEALQESEERFRVTFEQAAVGITHIDLEGRFLRINKKFCEIVGYNSEELLNHRFQDITFPADLVENLNYARSLLSGGIDNYEMDKRYIRKDGAIIWGHQTVSLVRDSTGEPKHFVAVIEDISDRRLAEEQLERSLEELRWKEALLQSMTSASPLAFYVVDNNTDTIVYFNHRFCEIWKLEHLEAQMCQGEFKNADLFPHCFPLLADKSAFTKAYKSLKIKENRATVEDEIALVDGRTLRFFSTQIRDKADHYFGRLYLFEDVSDRKQAEEALRQQFLKERLMGAIAQRIHQSLNLEDILNITVAEVRQFLACDRTIIYRLRPDGSGVVVVESVGSDWIAISGTVINDRYFADIYIQLYQQGRVQAVEDIYNAGLTQCHIDLLAWFQVRANLVVPIVHEGRLWGLLVAQQCSQTRQWQSLEIDLLKSLATQVAIAIQQSELYQQAQTEILQRQQVEEALRQQFQREHLVGAIAQRIRQSLNLERILERTVTEVRQVLQTNRVIIFRFQPDWSGYVVVESVDAPWSSILGETIQDPCFKAAYV
ncbi:MAG TPA: PAS domain S-box protein, partial [Coleofasciculaceae cyanobacterium]